MPLMYTCTRPVFDHNNFCDKKLRPGQVNVNILVSAFDDTEPLRGVDSLTGHL